MSTQAPFETATLADLRRRIDGIDLELHRLIMDRAAIIDALVTVKRAGTGGTVIRPEREAQIISRLATDHGGILPASAVGQIWRTLMAAFCHIQRPFAVHVAAAGGDLAVARDAARFYFGFSPELREARDVAGAVAAVAAEPGDVAVIALPTGEVPSDGDPWWTNLEPDGVHPITRIGDVPTAAGVLIVGGRAVGPGAAHSSLWTLPEERYLSEERKPFGLDARVLARSEDGMLLLEAPVIAPGITPPQQLRARRLGDYAPFPASMTPTFSPSAAPSA